MKKLKILLLLLLNQIINNNIIVVKSLINPEIREKHTLTLINNKLYILGGKFINNLSSIKQKEFFYLDLSSHFNINEILEWQEPILSNNNNGMLPPSHYAATTISGGLNNDEIILFGGQLQKPSTLLSPETQTSIFIYNTKENFWNIKSLTIGSGKPRSFINAVSDNKGKMYLFGGFEENSGGIFHDNIIDIFDTINFIWSKGTNINSPSPRHSYSATFLPNSQILYIGGISAFYGIQVESSFIDGSTIYLYDTINDKWDAKTTGGYIPSGIHSHSAVLAHDKLRVIVYGGTRRLITDSKIFVLSLIDYTWSAPRVAGGDPKMRTGHKSIVIGNYMLITFGFNSEKDLNGTINNLDPGNKELMILDISNNEDYYWINSFIPPKDEILPNNPNDDSNSKSNSSLIPDTKNSKISDKKIKNLLLNSILGSLFGIILLGLICFFFIKYFKKKSIKNLPGDEKVLPSDNELLKIDDDKENILQIASDNVERNILQIAGDNVERNILQIAGDNVERNILQIAGENNIEEEILRIGGENNREILRIGDENSEILQIAGDQEMQTRNFTNTLIC